MKDVKAALRWLLALLVLLPAFAGAQGTREQAPRLEVYVRDGCPHCAAAKEWLATLAGRRPELNIVLRQVDSDPEARADLLRISRQAGYWPPGVPTFVVRERVLVGFDDAEHSGAQLLALIDDGPPAATSVQSEMFGTLSVERLGLPLFTLALGLLDGFNPCAMWVLLFLLSLLVHLHDRARMATVAGTFVLVSGVVYYAFMAAWLNLFLLVGLSTLLIWTLGTVAIAIGVVNLRDGVRSGGDFTLSIPAAAKPGLYARMRTVLQADSLLPALVGVAALAVVVNFIELLCTAGLPAIFTAVLTQQGLAPQAHYAYLGLYIVGYIADDALMVATAVAALSSRKLSAQTGRGLKILSGLVMLTLGVIMLLRPDWLLQG
ncbi:NrdH-redoxin [Stutzerimonas stutzeri]|uniref:glutaredoxin family protein n=1 Tax=Stutzerimonas sp. S1 TaxID=3030652 RepID=UPI002223FEA9|nr:glutaredoxin domain-containing protein [Stutzerimonas sp. S1]MCW3148128.1 NrdH-redoxin [Stutzerimonas sp. S1]